MVPSRSFFALGLVAIGTVLSPLSSASSQTVMVPNFSFETPTLSNNGDSLATNSTADNYVWALTNTPAYGTATGQAEGIENPSGKFSGDNTGTGAITGSDGVNAAFINANGAGGSGTITSAASLATVAAGTTYTLTVAVGNPAGGGTQLPGSFTIALLVNGTVATNFALANANTAIADGTFADFTTSFTASSSQNGGALTVQLYHVNQGTGNANAQLFFDNLRVSAAGKTPPPTVPSVTVTGPSGNLSCAVTNVSGRLTFSVTYEGQTVVQPSPLGVTVAGQDLGAISALGTPTLSTIQETYPLKGGHATASNNCNVASIPVTAAVDWTLEVRAFDDGVAYRYNVPETGSLTVAGETSEWILPAGGTIYYQDAGNTSYESVFATSAISALTANQQLRVTAVTQLPGTIPLYVMMTEANLFGYSDMSLQYLGNNTFQSIFLGDPSGWTNSGAVLSPWRVTVVAPDLNTLTNTDILPNLCPAPSAALAAAAWIKPGRSSWEWLIDGHPAFANQTGWVDRTAQLGYEYYLIDDGWDNWTSGNLDAWGCMATVTAYAAPKGVAIWAWVTATNVQTSAQRAAYFQNAKNAGLVGLKIDFPQSTDAAWVQWYDDTLNDAATYQLMIDFHGCVKPTGRERTYPHEMTREAINGLENGPRPGLHDSVLPFTRFVQGHADYTPTDFGNNLGSNSYAHELAQAIVYTSPFFCYGGDPAVYLQNSAVDVLETISATWDETRVLSGSALGQVAGYARRKGQVWYVGVVNGATAGTFTAPFDFLTAGTPYVADELADSSSTNAAWVRTRVNLTNTSAALSTSMRAGGGFVARIVPMSLLPAAATGASASGGVGFVQVGWSAVAGATGYTVQRGTTSGGPYTTVGAALVGTALTDTSVSAGTEYFYTVAATNTYGMGNASSEVSAAATGTGLAAAWKDADVGGTGATGYATFYNGTYTINGAGADVWNSSDAFNFLSQSWSGDGVLIARVANMMDTDPWAKAGVMFRETLANNSNYSFAMMTPGEGTAFQLRNPSNVSANTTGVSAPYWVQLVRSGNSFSAYAAPDGVNWTQTGAATTNTMATNLYAGLAVCSHTAGTLNTAYFDNVSFLAAPAGLKVTYLSESQLSLSWIDQSSGETAYTVRRSPTGANNWVVIASTLPAGTPSYQDNGLAASTGYDYQVWATGPGANGPVAAITATTPAGIGDGIPGWWRYQYFGNGLTVTAASAPNADPDGDGISNFMEYATGTDPTKANSGPPAQLGLTSDQTKLTLTFNRVADPGLTYQVQATDDLTANPWPEVIWSSTGSNNVAGAITVIDTALLSAHPHRFLRLQTSH
jgi:alpha-glucosidase